MEKNRAGTDKSLRIERDGADKATRDSRDRLDAERAADTVVDLARAKADALMVDARDKADQESRQSQAIEQAIVVNERDRADEVLQVARATADDRLRREREESGKALAELLPLERQHTDRDLLTERARSDEALASRDDFLAIVSHDLRNLLGGIVCSSSTLTMRAAATDEGRQVVANRIQLYAARMNRLIGDLVDVVSIDAGKLACTIVPNDARAVIAEALETFRRVADDRGIALDADVQGVLPRGAFDYGRILQVLANLVSNALKFTLPGGKVCIRGEHSGDTVQFSVSDTGRGVREDLFPAVFLRFWQADADQKGTGLGLYISKSLVEAHGGRIWIVSKVGQGSTFHFTVPVAAGA